MAATLNRSRVNWLATVTAVIVLLASMPAIVSARAEPAPADDEPEVTLEINDVTVDEASDTATFTVTRRGKSNKATSVDIATSGIEAIDGVDYESRSITLSIPGRSKRTVTETFKVTLLNDQIAELDETFAVTLSNPKRATIEKRVGIGTIVDNDTAGIVNDDQDGLHVIEGDNADGFTIALSSEPTADVVISVLGDEDQLTLTPGLLTFTTETWAEAQDVSVTAVADGIDEDDPHFALISINGQSADPLYDTVATPDLEATIGDADALLVSIDGPTAGAPGQPAVFSALVNAGGSGKIVYEWTVFEEGNPTTTGNGSVFEFTPTQGGSHIIQAILSDDQSQTPATFLLFTALADVATSIFVEDIVWLADEGITRGCNPPGNDLFCPETAVTRGQMAAFLVRFLGLTDDGGGNTFTDDNDSVFEDDIAKLAAAGITQGCNAAGTEFCPDQQVTRGEMAAFLVRTLGLTGDAGSNTFIDDADSVFQDDIAKLSAAGITAGCNDPGTLFCPEGSVTRGQMAAFLNRSNDLP
ncbi:MAG: hypothetical protein GY788_15890 [bacterium]|nr:hypothetical protein [bacterium]